MTEIGSVIDGKYEILKEIGHGGMSTVYLSMDKRLNKQWAVKEIKKKGTGIKDEDIVNSLLAEADLMKRLDHPALPRIVDIIDNGITIYIVMDYIEGENLRKYLDDYGAQPAERVIEWGKQLCDALGYLHSQSLIYRDMKPYNVVLKTDGTLKVVDFGIMRKYNPNQAADPCCLGTKGYASPEQYSGQSDFRSDIFGLGMTMFYLVTGIEPRKTAYDANLIYAVNPNFPKGFEYIISKCTMLAAEDRYQNCSELMSDLNNYQKLPKRKGLIERLFAKKG